MAETVTWLHLSDLHAGLGGQKWLWPSVKAAFHDDLARLHRATGNWDVVIFSGDLVQSGTEEEYDLVTEALREIWALQASLGFTPKLLVVPGNHDLKRPDQSLAEVIAMKSWFTEEGLRQKFLSDPTSQYRAMIEEVFSGYDKWVAGLNGVGIPLAESSTGLLPGDFSARIEGVGASLGVVGLNSTWLQLGAGDYRSKLAVEIEQLHAVTGGDPDAWAAQNDANLIVTHHPTDWLNPEVQARWRSDISPSGRFDAHLFGHMHDPEARSTKMGGSQPRQSIQAASLFGLEKIGGKVSRTHGYSVGRVEKGVGIRIWPRLGILLDEGHWKMVPHEKMDLEDSSRSFLLTKEAPSSTSIALSGAFGTNLPVQRSIDFATDSARVLTSIQYFIPRHSAHANVRKIEQRQAHAALSSQRAIWLVSDWGSGADGFVDSIRSTLGLPSESIFRLDVSEYTDKNDFLSGFKSRLGVSFEQLSSTIAERGPTILIFDNVPTSRSDLRPGQLPPEVEIESIAAAILNFSPELHVVLRARKEPQHQTYQVVLLRPLDEADVRTYVSDHEHGGSEYMKPESVSAIYRHTDGLPARVNSTLIDLKVITVAQLTSTNRDLVNVGSSVSDVPPALAESIADLASSSEQI